MPRTKRCAVWLICGLSTGCVQTLSPEPADDGSSVPDLENRSIDGSANNRQHPSWGQAFTAEMRMASPAYADGMSAPAGEDRPAPRSISNIVMDQGGRSVPNSAGLSDWVWQWGQFLDHDLSLTQGMTPQEPFPISIPAGDTMFDPNGSGDKTITFMRSEYDPNTGSNPDNPRQQVNELSAFIDGTNVYGFDNQRAAWLRTGVGGRLKLGPDDLLPFSDGSVLNVGPGGAPSFGTELFTAGDIRANEQAGLTAVHTLFVREHNRLARELSAQNPAWTDEQVYQRTRKIVGAQLQIITYFEFLPAVLGSFAPDPREARYDPNVNPAIANEFAASAFRIGHTMLSPNLMRLDGDGTVTPEGPLPLRDAFFDPQRILLEGGIEPLFLGLASQEMQEIDTLLVEEVRNFLFGEPGQGGMDLAAVNIQRGRDHGLPDYNTMREAFGLTRKRSIAEISEDPQVRGRLEEIYETVDRIDPWVGGLAEDHVPGAQVGELVMAVWVDQFTRLRDGDWFFYRNDPAFSGEDVAQLEATKLADIIRRNTNINLAQDDVFRVSP